RRRAGLRVAGPDLLPDVAAHPQSRVSSSAQSVRDPGDCRGRRDHYAHSRRVQPDAVRDAHVPFVLHWHLRVVPARIASGEPAVPMVDPVPGSIGGTTDTGSGGLLRCLPVWISLGPEVAVPVALIPSESM